MIDLSAAPFLALLVPVILAFGWNWGLRFGGVVLYTIGAAPALLMYASLTLPVTGDLRPGFLHPELVGMVHKAPSNVPDEVDDSIAPAAWKIALFRGLDRTMGALVGSKGVLSHFPVIVVGVLGLSLVLRRHWPASTKVMAAVTLIGAVGIMGGYIFLKVDWTQAMFGPRWFIVFLPLVLFWAGAWLRKRHHAVTWSMAGLLLAFSVTVSVIGAAAPFVRAEPGQYTVVAALHKLANPTPIEPAPGRQVQVVDSR